MRPLIRLTLSLLLLLTCCWTSAQSSAVICNEPLNSGRIEPELFGNFIELLDDVVPGMWAEMLNDRSFEGIAPLSTWCYYDGAPDICDRPWDTNAGWSYDTNNPFNGARCARISDRITQSGLATKKGMTCRFSGYFRADNPTTSATVLLKTLLPDGRWMTLASAKLPRMSIQWKKYSLQLVCNGETDRAVFELKVQGRGNLWADKLSLMPADNVQGWRRDVIDTVKGARPALVRFGGSVCDPGGYRWKNGIGDRDLRVPFANKVWGRLDPNDVGIDEFCQFCEAVRAAPLICLSFSDGPQNAADLVEYCNGNAQTEWGAKRAANGRRAAYAVKYWQIGNEISGDDDNYVGKFPRFVERMKKADPSIKILSSFPTQKLLDRVGAQIDFIAPHHYTPDLGGCENEFRNLSRMIDSTPGCAGIKIAVTEWNTSGGDWGLGRAQFLTLGTALRNARYIQVMMRHCDKVKIGCRSNMANSFCGAMIETSPAGVLKRPSYFVMQLYARRALPEPLKVEQTGDSPDVFACASENRKSAVIFAVNDRREPVNWSWRMEGLGLRAVGAECVCDTHDARQPDVENHWNDSERIKISPLAVGDGKISLPALSATAIEFTSP